MGAGTGVEGSVGAGVEGSVVQGQGLRAELEGMRAQLVEALEQPRAGAFRALTLPPLTLTHAAASHIRCLSCACTLLPLLHASQLALLYASQLALLQVWPRLLTQQTASQPPGNAPCRLQAHC